MDDEVFFDITNQMETAEQFWSFVIFGPSLLLSPIIHFLMYPFFRLYLYGPSYGIIGFWGGRDYSEICYELSGHSMSAAYWKSSPEIMKKCKSLVFKRFEQFFTIILILLYIYILNLIVKGIFYFVNGMLQLLKEKIYQKYPSVKPNTPIQSTPIISSCCLHSPQSPYNRMVSNTSPWRNTSSPLKRTNSFRGKTRIQTNPDVTQSFLDDINMEESPDISNYNNVNQTKK